MSQWKVILQLSGFMLVLLVQENCVDSGENVQLFLCFLKIIFDCLEFSGIIAFHIGKALKHQICFIYRFLLEKQHTQKIFLKEFTFRCKYSKLESRKCVGTFLCNIAHVAQIYFKNLILIQQYYVVNLLQQCGLIENNFDRRRFYIHFR